MNYRIHLRSASLLVVLLPCSVWAQERIAGSLSAAEAHLARAEAALQEQELALAESEYRSAGEVALTSLGLLDLSRERFDSAFQSFQEASEAVADARQSQLYLSLVHLRRGNAGDAVPILRDRLARDRLDLPARKLLAQALMAMGRTQEAIWELKDGLNVASEDVELLYILATNQLGLGQLAETAVTFDRLKRVRPIAATHVLVGRTYRDFGYYLQAEGELRRALQLDPRARRAHYYLGTVYLQREGSARVEEARTEFEKELSNAPDDYLSNLYLGIVRVALREYAAAIPRLRRATRQAPREAAPLFYLGHAYYFTGHISEAIRTLSASIPLADNTLAGKSLLGNAHYLLAQSLRKLGKEKQALPHYARAQELKADVGRNEEERIRQYVAGEPQFPGGRAVAELTASRPLPGSLVPSGRAEERLRGRLRTVVSRVYFNLGTLQAKQEHFRRAAAFFQRAARWEPGFPSVQYSLGLAHYHAGQHAEAIPALKEVVEADPRNARARRLLGLSYFHIEQYEKAAPILASDPETQTDSGLQYALGVSLVRSGRTAEAAPVFDRLLTAHSTSPELLLLLGQAYAQQQDHESALASYRRALELNPSVPEAHYFSGQVHLRAGRLPEAEQEFRMELQDRPEDLQTRYHLAYVLELEQKTEEAISLLNEVLRTQPSHADARYLLGKIFMDRNQFGPATEQLEAAANLAPDKPHIRYQLGQAYQKIGRMQEAEQEFARFRELKLKQREKP